MRMKSGADKVLKLLLVAAAVLVAFKTVQMMISPSPTQTARIGSYTNSIELTCYIVRGEEVIQSPVEGIIEAEVSEGERVSAYSPLGAVVTGQIDPAMTDELEDLNKRIDAIKNSIGNSGVLSIDDSNLSGTMELSLKNLKYAAAKGNVQSMVSLSEDIKILTDRRAGLTSGSSAQQNLDALTARRDAIASSLGGVRTELYAPKAGLYSANVDGLEGVLTTASLEGITPDKIASFDSLSEGAVKGGLCKIVDNYVWYTASNIPFEETDGLVRGGSYTVTFKDSGGKSLLGEVVYISEPDSDNLCAVVIKFNGYLENFTSLRKTDISVCKAKYTGLYIPAEALRVVGGVTGVFVRNEKTEEFREVRILYKSEDFILAERETGEVPGRIKLYDKVVLDPSEDKGNQYG